MIIEQQQFYREFERIYRDSLTHSTVRIAIFVSCFDIDAICSCKMYTEFLRKNQIVFQMIPVIGYLDLKEKYNRLDKKIKNIVLLGCGATADLESFLDIDLEDFLDTENMSIEEANELISKGDLDKVLVNRKIYIIDGHRPWNLDNLYGSPVICCVDDNSTNELNKEKEAFYFLVNTPEDEEEDQHGSDDDDDDEDNGSENLEELADTDDDEELDLEDSLDRKRHREDNPERLSAKKKRRMLIDEYQDLIESYYQQGSTISIPSSYQMYDVLSSLGEGNIDSLWLSIVGARSLREIYQKVYQIVYPGLSDEVLRIQSIDDSYSMRSNSTKNDENESFIKFDPSKKADNVSIQSCKEYTLFLLHHWSLFDSFFYSNYVNAKCHIYTNDGKRLLKTIFARMGISLNQASQNWKYIDLELKKSLNGLIQREAEKFNLNEIIISGFKRNYGFSGSISSGDYVESIQAILENNFHADFKDTLKDKSKWSSELSNNNQSSNKTAESFDEQEQEEDGEVDFHEKNKNEQFLTSFWRAYDSLDDYEAILNGMEIAKFQQQFIFEKGSEILQKSMVKTQSKFKILILNESFTNNASITTSNLNISNFNKSKLSINDDRVIDIKSFGNGSKMFQNPLILTKLGNWILNVQSELDGGLLPLLIGAYNHETNTYLICGLPSRTVFDEAEEENAQNDDKRSKQKVILNAFSVLFEKVTQEITIQARMDSFQSAVIELRKEDLTRFLDGLNRYSQQML